MNPAMQIDPDAVRAELAALKQTVEYAKQYIEGCALLNDGVKRLQEIELAEMEGEVWNQQSAIDARRNIVAGAERVFGAMAQTKTTEIVAVEGRIAFLELLLSRNQSGPRRIITPA